MKKYSYYLKGLDCANCARKIQEELAKQKEFSNVCVNFAACKLTLETEEVTPQEKIEELVKKIEPEVELNKWEEPHPKKESLLFPIGRILAGVLLGILAMLLPISEIGKTILWLLGYTILLYPTAITAGKKLFGAKQIDESLLITISCIGAFCIGEKLEGMMVIFLYEIGEILEEKAVGHSRKSIQKLMNIRPEYANRKKEEGLEKVLPQTVKKGEIIVVKQGEKVPLDGIVLEGNSNLDTSTLTGESKWREVSPNDEVLSGSINLGPILTIKVTKEYENSTVYKIIELVENATDKKAKTETFVTKIAQIYTPIVIVLAFAIAIFLPMIAKEISYSTSLYRALAFLVISCPCAIAISVPLRIFFWNWKSVPIWHFNQRKPVFRLFKANQTNCFG